MNASEAQAVLDALDLWDDEHEALREHNPNLASAIDHLNAIVAGEAE